nr:hypothetical protein [Myxococcota bacterium]
IGAVLFWWKGASDAAAIPPPPPVAPTVTIGDPEPEAPAFEPDPDPWAADVPEVLEPIHARLSAGRTLTSRDRSTIRRYVIRERDDPRPWLLLAHGGFLEGARTDACDRYGRALDIDVPLVRGDRHALPDLARMAAHHVVADCAAALIRQHWGARALPELDAAIATTPARDEEDLARLHLLRDRIAISATAGVARPQGG